MISREQFEDLEVGQIVVGHMRSRRFEVIAVRHIPEFEITVVTFRSDRGKILNCMWWDRVYTLPDRRRHIDIGGPNSYVDGCSP